MKRIPIAVLLAVMAAPVALAQISTWATDPNHSEVDFTVRHMGVSNVHGRIGGVKGVITVNAADSTKSTVSVTIDVTTIDTGVIPRDNDLKGANFFDVAQYPTASFSSTSVTVNGMSMKVNGNLTLHGITRPVELDVEGPSAPMPGMDHKPHSGYSATTTIKRKDFGIGPNFPVTAVGDDVKLSIDLEVVKQ